MFCVAQTCTPPCEGIREVILGAGKPEPGDWVMGVDGDMGTEGAWRRGLPAMVGMMVKG